MFAFGGMQIHRYKQRVLTRRFHAGADQTISLPAENDWHLVKVWTVGSGGRGGPGAPGNAFAGGGGGGAGGIASGRYQADPLIHRDFVCDVGAGNSAASTCNFYDTAIAALRTLTGNGGGAGQPSTGTRAGGLPGTAAGGQLNTAGGRGGNGPGRGGGGAGIGGANGQNATAGGNGVSGDGATGNEVDGIRAEMTAWGYQFCCGGQGGWRGGAGPTAGQEGCGGGGAGMRLEPTDRRRRGANGGAIGGGGGGGMDGGGVNADARTPGSGGAGHVFILY